MCLKVTKTVPDFETKTFYKVVRIQSDRLGGYALRSVFHDYTWARNNSENKFYDDVKVGNIIHYGFHVFVNEEDAKLICNDYCAYYAMCYRVIKVIGKKEDFVAEGIWAESFNETKCCVFTKLEVPEEEFKDLQNGKS